MNSRFIARIGISLATFMPLALTSCGGGGSGSSETAPAQAQADVLVGGVAADGLFSFSAEIESVRLQRADGSFTPDLAGSVGVEFLGLGDAWLLLAHASLEAGTYTGIELGFLPDSYQALADDGTELTIQASTDTLFSPLPAAVSVEEGGYASFSTTLDLVESLSGDRTSGTLAFDPMGPSSSDDGEERKPIDKIAGKLVRADESAQSLVIDAYARGNHQAPLGEITVQATPETLFLDAEGNELTAGAFFALLVPETSWLEVHGELGANGEVSATRVDLTDRGGPHPSDSVTISGVVLSTATDMLVLRIRAIERGEEVAKPVLEGLADRGAIEVSYDGTTLFSVEGHSTTSESLKVGQEVEVEFCAFVAPPFPACRIDIRGAKAEFEGVITASSGLPDAIVMRLDPEDPAIRGGVVQDENTDVVVTLEGSTIRLQLRGRPEILPAQLAIGLRCTVEGTLSGSATAPTIAAGTVGVYPGRLSKAALAGLDPMNASFGTEGGEIENSFGSLVEPGAHWVLVDPACSFQGRISSQEEFFRVLAGTSPVELDVRGIGTGVLNEIRAYGIRAKD